jgi:hypothetical protein
MSEIKPISVANLKVDQQNPRLADPRPTSQVDTLVEIAKWDDRKLLGIAKHIAARGLDPSNLPIVMQEEPRSRFYVVLEGNRRITAVKALENPDLIAPGVSGAVLKGLKQASADYATRRIETIQCLVLGSRVEARPWIEVRHRGFQEGAGLIPWESLEGARYAEQFGDKKSYGLRVLEFLHKLSALDEETQAAIRDGFALSTLERLLANPKVMETIGLRKSKGDLVGRYPDAEVAKPLTRIVGDIAHKRIKVSHVDNKKLMASYLKKFKADERPDPKREGEGEHIIGTQALADAAPKRPRKAKKKKSKRSHERATLIPAAFDLDIEHDRCRDIFGELGELPVSNYRNSVAVLSRVFLELSLDVYIKKHRIWTVEQLKGSSLAQKMNAVAQRLKIAGTFDEQQLLAIQRAARDDSRLAPTVKTLHQYIHNEHMVPLVADLNAEWKILEPLIAAVWA